MKLKTSSRIILFISVFSFIGVLALGSWWLYLLIKINTLGPSAFSSNIMNLAKWEGGTFLALLTMLTSSFAWLYFNDLRKTKSLQTFFSSLTHELKTPLASIRLQSEVLAEKIESNNPEAKELAFAERLIEDTQNLEVQMDKIIQLSKMQRSGKLNLSKVNLSAVMKEVISNYAGNIEVEVSGLKNIDVLGDQLALELILKNLIENTKFHAEGSAVNIQVVAEDEFVKINYSDGGIFKGDTSKLGKLFYTNNSTRGSGIGLHLIKKLSRAMSGNSIISTIPTFNVTITLGRSR